MASLEDRVAALERELKKLQTSSLNLGPQQKGPLPGWFRAARIEGNQMLINMTDSMAGVSPRISVTDTSNVTRAELGNLAAYTGPNGVVSPAQYGFRANDSSGNAIFDSLGLIAVMKLVAQGTGLNGTLVCSAVPQAIGGTTTSYVVPAGRSQTFLTLALLSVSVLSTDNIQWLVDTTGQQSANAPLICAAGTDQTAVTLFSVNTFAANTIVKGQVMAFSSTTPTATLFANTNISIFLIGA